MEKLDQLIKETRDWRTFHRDQYLRGIKGAGIEAAACAIRERALLDARTAITSTEKQT